MKILSINTHNPSFGQVRKSAAQIAIDKAGGNPSELKRIKRLVEGQKDNLKYDIIASRDPDYTYEVVDADGTYFCMDTKCNNFDFACAIASNLNQSYETIGLVEKIFANCKD